MSEANGKSVIAALFILGFILMGCDRQSQIQSNPCPTIPSQSTTISLDSDLEGESIAAVIFDTETQNWIIAYTSGRVVSLDALGQVTPKLDLEPLDVKLTRISADGNTLVTSVDGHLQAWDLKAGGEIEGGSNGDVFLNVYDISVTPNADRAGLAASGAYMTPVRTKGGGFLYDMGQREDYTEITTSIALNPSDSLLAYGSELTFRNDGQKRGDLGILSWNGQWLEMSSSFRLGPLMFPVAYSSERVPIRLAFDMSGQWLAVLNERSIDLHEAKSLSHRVGHDFPLTEYGTLAFSPSSTHLAVGYNQGLRVFTVPDLDLVLDKQGAGVAAVAFSSDGCKLAWGDVEGAVNIIDVPKP